jgi:LysM repeat protein
MRETAEAATNLQRGRAARRVLAASICIALLATCNPEVRRTAGPSTVASRTTIATTTTVATTTTTTAPPITYQVKWGDTLTAIARRFGVSIAAIVATNHLADPDHITEGQVLQIPPAPPVKLVITPPEAQAGEAFGVNLTGAKPSETITFEIDSPDGKKFTGPPHTASPDGAVTATYQTFPVDATGTYFVMAKGNQGTSAQAIFQVDPANTPP